MVQWTSFRQIKRFVNRTRLYIACGKSVDLHLVELDLTAGRLAADEIWAKLEILKACCRSKYIFHFV